MNEKLTSTIQVCRILDIPEHKLVYALRADKLSEPPLRVGGRRIFTEDDIIRVANYFGVDLKGGCDE